MTMRYLKGIRQRILKSRLGNSKSTFRSPKAILPRAVICCVVFVLSTLTAHGQNESANWYFGIFSGLDFNSAAPVELTDGSLFTVDGCATVSNAQGELLFYSNAWSIWNRNHQEMPNGFDLQGNPSSTQGVIIVPQPNTTDIYYVFTTDELGESGGLQYHVVDMRREGGLGDVTVKNNYLLNSSTEKLTAVLHANGEDVWILAHEYQSDAFMAYLLTENGLQTTPVVTNIGPVYASGFLEQASRGSLKASHDGTKVVAGSADSHFDLFNFDANTGVLSNRIDLSQHFRPFTITPDIFFYGLEFSPDNTKLYASVFYQIGLASYTVLHQFDVAVHDFTAISNSAYELPRQDYFVGGLQLAIDGKIYGAQENRLDLSVINNPNAGGAALDYEPEGLTLTQGMSAIGFPQLIVLPQNVRIMEENVCLGSPTIFSLENADNNLGVLWDFGDGTTSNEQMPQHTYATTGQYMVTVEVTFAGNTVTEDKTITIFDTPVVTTPADFRLCDTDNDGYAIFDLSTKDAEIFGTLDQTRFTLAYYSSRDDAENAVNPIINPDFTNTVPNVQEVFARVSNNSNSMCFVLTSFRLFADPSPVLQPVTDWAVCDTDGDGIYDFNLADKAPEILGTRNGTFFTIRFFQNQADADTNMNPIIGNYQNTAPMETIYYRIANTANTSCFAIDSFNISVFDFPTAIVPTDLRVCDLDNDGFQIFDLTLKDPEILGALPPQTFVVSYHGSLVDAENNVDQLAATNFTNTVPEVQSIYARVSHRENAACFDVVSFGLRVDATPMLQTVTDWEVCDADVDGVFDFDLTQKIPEILGAQDATLYGVQFFENQGDADSNNNPIVGNYQNTLQTETIYYRVENNNNGNCFVVGSFAISVSDLPTASSPADFNVCDDDNDGFLVVDLSIKDTEILGTLPPQDFEVSYHTSLTDAENDLNRVIKTNFTNTTPSLQQLHARVTNTNNSACFDVVSFHIVVHATPVIEQVADWLACDDDGDGFFDFDLAEKLPEILNGQNGTLFTVAFFGSQQDANSNTNPILGNYRNSGPTETLYYRITNMTNAACFGIGNFSLIITPRPRAAALGTVTVCNTLEDPFDFTYDLTQLDVEILDGQNPNTLQITYFENQTDAESGQNGIINNTVAYTGSDRSIYVRVAQATNTDCFITERFTLSIPEAPNPLLEDSYAICPDAPQLLIYGGPFDTWEWRDGAGTLLSTEDTLQVEAVGEYNLTVTELTNGTRCERTSAFEVFSSGVPEQISVGMTTLSTAIVELQVAVVGNGNFEYSLDGVNFQASNIFQVNAGTFTIFVRDIGRCRTITEEIFVVGYPRFFTPNGDRVNEFWNVVGVATDNGNASVSIFDRYGTLLSQVSPSSIGWNGTYKGNPMPASDYWFIYENGSGQQLKGHFTLKR